MAIGTQRAARRKAVKARRWRKPPLYITQILAWGDAYHRRNGHWPRPSSGKIPVSPRETWETVYLALRDGKRDLPVGTSLGKLWAEYRGVRNIHSIPKFSTDQILGWADAHYRRTGAWPQVRSGPIAESPTDNWTSVDSALRLGLRGMRDGSSLKPFLDRHRRNEPADVFRRSQGGAGRRAIKPR